ncbi:unnamed protein product [Coffea canephora]|uniref:Uncharacterized protein n=2 Tax=Coffea TaxID=13442 RepID=A0A068TR10_COFCA|nr:late embryogenesis abundant protein 37-like [Coffea arabica]CDO97798.1 unnamed protein product [Coffea canephora]
MSVVLRSNGAVLFLRRAYTVAVENVKAQPAASVMRKVAEPSTSNIDVGKELVVQGAKREVFWMKDPKTGNWIPENHFNEVDAAELREKFLSKAPKP